MPHARWAFLALLPLAACVGCQAPPPVTKPVPPPPKLSAADSAFLTQAAQADQAEIQEAQLADDRAPRPTVRQLARQMLTDHTRNSQALTTLAQNKGVTVPTAPDPQQTAQLHELEPLRGRAFDRAYIADQVSDHEQAIALYQQEADQGSDPEVKAFAEQTLPILRQHLSMAEALSPAPRRARREEGI
jgi:putative membrane protein